MRRGWAFIAANTPSVQSRITSSLVQQSWAYPSCRLPLTSEKYSGCSLEIFLPAAPACANV